MWRFCLCLCDHRLAVPPSVSRHGLGNDTPTKAVDSVKLERHKAEFASGTLKTEHSQNEYPAIPDHVLAASLNRMLNTAHHTLNDRPHGLFVQTQQDRFGILGVDTVAKQKNLPRCRIYRLTPLQYNSKLNGLSAKPGVLFPAPTGSASRTNRPAPINKGKA